MYIVPIVDQTMLAGICGLAEGGIYTTIIYMTSAMQMPYRSIVKVSTPVVTNLWKERDMEGMRRISREMSLVNLIVGSFLFLLIWVNLDNIFSLMPGSYSDGRYVFLFLGLARVMDMYSGLNGTILVTSKKYRYDFTFSLMLVALTVASNALLIHPRLGHDGRGACHDDHRAGLQRDPDRICLEILPHPAVRALRSARRRAGGRMYRRVGPRSADGALHRRRSDPQRAGRRAVRRSGLFVEIVARNQSHDRPHPLPVGHPPRSTSLTSRDGYVRPALADPARNKLPLSAFRIAPTPVSTDQ